MRRLFPTGLALGLAAVAAVAAGCGGSGSGGVHTASPSPNRTVVTAPPSSLPGQVPTVFDCGGGAYEPATLLVQCGLATTTTSVTGIHWTSWTANGAEGSGTVNLAGAQGHGSGGARLQLGTVVQSGNGPQFSRLTVTWTGASPDGRPTDEFQLAVAPGR